MFLSVTFETFNFDNAFSILSMFQKVFINFFKYYFAYIKLCQQFVLFDYDLDKVKYR